MCVRGERSTRRSVMLAATLAVVAVWTPASLSRPQPMRTVVVMKDAADDNRLEAVLRSVGGRVLHPLSVIDMFRTPHTNKLHVVEHFKVTSDNKFLEAFVKIEDEDTFNEPMYMTKRWQRDPNEWRETICAENSESYFNANLVPIPQAERPDF